MPDIKDAAERLKDLQRLHDTAIPRVRLSELEFRLEVLERAVARLYDAFDEYRVANGNDDEDDFGSFV